ncbi:myelin-oligodendrocyte glycoprotein-like [Trematomus bernacchii]|uniref:myelin-oligodendrocyte glycoprotein-like n=1 Tax=Trematomus bernacchii TaxID=40690 RepID=UPI00146E85ED|nr:myelin-oligodendrocyte glycoprotein-like [Trematomus bernacchii]
MGCSSVSPSPVKLRFIFVVLWHLSSLAAGIFVVNVTQASYQAEENQNITLEWTFSTRRDTSLSSITIVCDLVSFRPYNLLHLYKGIEFPETQDPQFAGRVQWDKDVVTEGRITLHVSRLRTNDSGLYVCKVFTDYGRNNGRCCLNVTAAKELEPQRPTESWRRLWFIVVITTLIVFVLSIACIVLIRYKRRTHNAAMQMESSSEES